MNLYIIGPVTGVPSGNRPAFEEARERLKTKGYEVEIPHDTIHSTSTHPDAMRQSIKRLLEADGVVILDCWWKSIGASVEETVASMCGIPTHSVEVWMEEA